jgi:molybdopterin-guanine dinucleotide biosynthesis protein A
MGGVDKGMIPLAGRPMIQYVLERIQPQVGAVVISANRHLDAYRRYGWPVVTDITDDFPGPLAGVLAGMRAAKTAFVLTVPCDAPRLPDELLSRLWHALHTGRAQVALAHDGVRAQRAFLFMRRDLQNSIGEYLDAGERSIERWLAKNAVSEVDFSDHPRAFFNVNTPDDLAGLEL